MSPRIGVVYDISGNGSTIVRGGWGIFFDRPQGNIVFDMGNNAPGMLQLDPSSTACCRTSPGPPGIPYPTLGMQPTAYDFDPPKV